MLNKIKVTPLAAESLGVRSMCTLVETPGVNLLLDAGISLCPYRFSLPPHPLEFEKINSLRKLIAKVADMAQVVTISHYHFDHHTPSFEDWLVNWTEQHVTARQIYQNKDVLIKNPKEKINASQRQRAWLFQKTGGTYAKKLDVADGKAFSFGETKISFSPPVPHGSENSMLGWVIMTLVEHGGERFMFAPDVQGPMSTQTLALIKEAKPDIIMLGGPPFYLAGFRVDESQLEIGLKNLASVVETASVVILEHHALRDESWQKRASKVFGIAAKTNHTVVTAAEFNGQKNCFLESKRKQLYADFPPSQEFKLWMRTLSAKKIVKPPL